MTSATPASATGITETFTRFRNDLPAASSLSVSSTSVGLVGVGESHQSKSRSAACLVDGSSNVVASNTATDSRYGAFGPPVDLDVYWRDPEHIPLIIRAGGRVAGFALIDRHSHSGLPLDRNFGEFFVMRKYRRGGVASAAVSAIVTGYPGVWEAAIMQRNTAAQAFWPRAVAAAPGVRDIEKLEGDGVEWTGPILRFAVEA